MRRSILLACITCWVSLSIAQDAAWAPVEGKITTTWAAEVSPAAVLPEYPRPQMVRERWLNLNGLWDYAIVPKESEKVSTYDGKILVPLAVESALSGVVKRVGKENVVVYRRTVHLPSPFRIQSFLL